MRNARFADEQMVNILREANCSAPQKSGRAVSCQTKSYRKEAPALTHFLGTLRYT